MIFWESHLFAKPLGAWDYSHIAYFLVLLPKEEKPTKNLSVKADSQI